MAESNNQTRSAAAQIKQHYAPEIKRLRTEVAELNAKLRLLTEVGMIAGAKAVAQAMTMERDRVYEHMRMLGGKIGPLERQAEHLRQELIESETRINSLTAEVGVWKRRAARLAAKAKPRVIYAGPIGKLLPRSTMPKRAGATRAEQRSTTMAKKPKGGRKGGRGC